MAQPKQTRRVEIIRPVRLNGEILAPGSVVEATIEQVSDLVSGAKAKVVDPETKLKKDHDVPKAKRQDVPPPTGEAPAKGRGKGSAKDDDK